MYIAMKKIQYIVSALLVVAVAAMSLSSCSSEKLGPTIFPPTEDELDPTATTYQLDKFLQQDKMDALNRWMAAAGYHIVWQNQWFALYSAER